MWAAAWVVSAVTHATHQRRERTRQFCEHGAPVLKPFFTQSRARLKCPCLARRSGCLCLRRRLTSGDAHDAKHQASSPQRRRHSFQHPLLEVGDRLLRVAFVLLVLRLARASYPYAPALVLQGAAPTY